MGVHTSSGPQNILKTVKIYLIKNILTVEKNDLRGLYFMNDIGGEKLKTEVQSMFFFKISILTSHLTFFAQYFGIIFV